jgi:hypothetical protein
MRRLIPLAFLLAAGCTPLQWSRPDTSPEQFSQDVAFCQQEAWREAQWHSFLFLNRYYGGTTIVDSRGRHMFVPYAPFGDPFGDRYYDEARLTHFCMRAKGYDLVPVESAKAETIQPSEGGTPSGKP